MKSADVTMGKASAALGLFLTGVALVYAHDQPQTEAVSASVVADGSLTPLAARFAETRREPDHAPSPSDWYFVRSDSRIETAQQDYAEIWERDEREALTLTRVFHGDRKLIEYTPGELRAQRRLKDWSALATILDRRTLERLKRGRATTALKQPAVRYAGQTGRRAGRGSVAHAASHSGQDHALAPGHHVHPRTHGSSRRAGSLVARGESRTDRRVRTARRRGFGRPRVRAVRAQGACIGCRQRRTFSRPLTRRARMP